MMSTSCTTSTSSDKKTKLEVCQGPDCFGSGGGAAILEIEELLQEKPTTTINNVELVRGGCRNFCTMGPNVHLHASSSQQHFTKVQTVQDCAAIVDQIVSTNNDADNNKSSTCNTYYPMIPTPKPEPSIAVRMMRQRAERRRWEFLREVAQVKRKQQHRRQHNTNDNDRPINIDALSIQMEQVIIMETTAEKEEPKLLGRAQRRKERFHSMLTNMTNVRTDVET